MTPERRRSSDTAKAPRAPDAIEVRAQSIGVESLHDRGVTWVSFKPMPDLACGIDFALRKFPDLGLLSGTVQGVRQSTRAETAATAMTISAFT